MAKVKMKHDVLTRIACVLISLLIWFYVVYTEKTMDEVWIRNIPVTFTNSKTLTDNGLVILSGEQQKIDIKIKGVKNVIAGVKADDVSATYDLALVKEVGTLYPSPTITINVDGVTVTEKKNTGSALSIDKIIDKDIEVTASLVGAVAEPNFVDVTSVSPAVIHVKGPSKIVEDLTAVTEDIDVTGITESGNVRKNILLKNAKGEVVSSELVSADADAANVDYAYMTKKTVDIVVRTTGANSHFEIAAESTTPSKITLVGDASRLSAITSVVTEPIDVSTIASSVKVTTNLVLPDHITTEEKNVLIEVSLKATPRQET